MTGRKLPQSILPLLLLHHPGEVEVPGLGLVQRGLQLLDLVVEDLCLQRRHRTQDGRQRGAGGGGGYILGRAQGRGWGASHHQLEVKL